MLAKKSDLHDLHLCVLQNHALKFTDTYLLVVFSFPKLTFTNDVQRTTLNKGFVICLVVESQKAQGNVHNRHNFSSVLFLVVR